MAIFPKSFMVNKKSVLIGAGMSRNPSHFFRSVESIHLVHSKVQQAKIDCDRSLFNSVEAFKS
jgi:hypothetical protein